MNKTNLFLLPLVALGLTACADGSVMEAKPEIIIKGTSIAKARSIVAQVCDENQLFIEQQSENTVVCSKSGGASAQFFLGTKGGAEVLQKIQFNIFTSMDGGVKISGSTYMEEQNAFGRIERTMFKEGYYAQGVRQMLNTIKGRLSKGAPK